jgi:hypothetical protein
LPASVDQHYGDPVILIAMEIRRVENIKYGFGVRTNVIAGTCISLGLFFLTGISSFAYSAYRQSQRPAPGKVHKEKKSLMTNHASGTFEVKMTNAAPDDKGAAIGRFSLDKRFHGDLEGTSNGEMLAVNTAVPGSAGYVAMEQVTGKLNGRTGTFALQHTGTMTRGAPELSVTVVPDSGTGELAGLSGKMDIKITDGKHFYEFDYTLAHTP